MQIEMEHQDESVRRHLREHTLGDCSLRFFYLVFGIIAIALARLAKIGRKNIARNIQGKEACCQDAFVVDQACRAAAAGQHHHILARPVGAAVR